MGARPAVFGTGALAAGRSASPRATMAVMDAWTPANVVVSALAAIVAILLAAVGFFLRRTVSQNDEAHRELKGDIGEVRTDLGEVKTDVAVLKTDVADLKTDVADLKTDVADLKTDVADLRTELAEVKTDVADLKTDVADLKTNVAVIRTIVEERGREDRRPAD